MSRLTLQGNFNCTSCGKEQLKPLAFTMTADGILSIDSECLKDYQICSNCKSAVNPYIETASTQFATGRSLVHEVRELRQDLIRLKYELNNAGTLIGIEKADTRKLLECIETRLASIEDDVTSIRLWTHD